MLSQHDRRALADIENHLRTSDPDFARRLEHPSECEPARRRRGRVCLRVILAGLVAALALLATAFAARSADAVVWAGVALMTAAGATAVWTADRFRHRHDHLEG